ncbi:MAG: hypothetical protein WCG80_19445 [Spirochaetales bacterium]
MTISSDLPTPPLARPAAPPSGPEAGESKAVADRDGDSDDAGSRVSLKSYQGTKVNTTA